MNIIRAVEVAIVAIALIGCSAPHSGLESAAPLAPETLLAGEMTSTAPNLSGSLDWPNEPMASLPGGQQVFDVDAIRCGVHGDFDRVVVELSGGMASELNWLADYTEVAASQGRGEPVELESASFLRVIIRGLRFPPSDLGALQGVMPDCAVGQLGGVYFDPVFEGQAQIFVATGTPAGYRISTMESPARLVIDIVHR